MGTEDALLDRLAAIIGKVGAETLNERAPVSLPRAKTLRRPNWLIHFLGAMGVTTSWIAQRCPRRQRSACDLANALYIARLAGVMASARSW